MRVHLSQPDATPAGGGFRNLIEGRRVYSAGVRETDGDPESETRRNVWVLPLLFALVLLAMPVQDLIMERYDDEPYPGLRMPQFDGDGQDDGVVELSVLSVWVDGQEIPPREFQDGQADRARRFLREVFPREQGTPRLDEGSLNLLRETSERVLGAPPHTMAVTWDRRWFDLRTGELSYGPVLSRYRVDIGAGR
jgi:hypothetical protein